MTKINETRRSFLRRAALTAAAVPFLLNCTTDSLAQKKSSGDLFEQLRRNANDLGAEGMGAREFPADVSWRTRLSTAADRGEQLLISGTVYDLDGKTAVPNALIYLYHTDSEGFYGRKKGETQHGRYRSWMLTDARGRYEFQTIKPAPYPNRQIAAHVHMTITTVNRREDWFDDILFEGDPLISARERAKAGEKGGFQPILNLKKNADGLWTATRDIQLWKM